MQGGVLQCHRETKAKLLSLALALLTPFSDDLGSFTSLLQSPSNLSRIAKPAPPPPPLLSPAVSLHFLMCIPSSPLGHIIRFVPDYVSWL